MPLMCGCGGELNDCPGCGADLCNDCGWDLCADCLDEIDRHT